MTTSLRLARALLLACAALLAACDDDDPPAQDAGTPDAGSEEWDGGYTVLPDHGDSRPTGPLSACNFNPALNTAANCADLANYTLTGCDTASLNTLEPQGIYQTTLRRILPEQDGGIRIEPGEIGFQLVSDGGTSTMRGLPLTSVRAEPGRFTLEQTVRRSPTVQDTQLLVGCRATNPNRFDGCYVRCVNGSVRATGTFDAVRMKWMDGEAESSGGLRLRSESAVPHRYHADVYVTRGHAYVVSVGHQGEPGGLTVFDVSNPDQPTRTASISLPEDNYWNGVWAKDNALYVASNVSGVIVYDISNPGQPAFVRNEPGGGPVDVHTVFVEGDRLYATQQVDLGGETLVFDVSNPLAPVLLNRFALEQDPNAFPLIQSPHDLLVTGGRAYVCHSGLGYAVFDVADPANIRLLGRYTAPTHGSHATAVGTFAGRTIAFEGGEGPQTHLRVLDATDPARMVKIGEFRLRPQTSIHNFVLKDKRLYIAYYHEGVRVLDVSNPTQPRQVAHYNTFRETDPGRTDRVLDGAIGIRVPGDGRVYVVDTARGLLIFDEP
jgi:hypothetical protein